jgi:hypothetical protein
MHARFDDDYSVVKSTSKDNKQQNLLSFSTLQESSHKILFLQLKTNLLLPLSSIDYPKMAKTPSKQSAKKAAPAKKVRVNVVSVSCFCLFHFVGDHDVSLSFDDS